MLNSKKILLPTVLVIAALLEPVLSAEAAKTIRLKDKTISVPEHGFSAALRKDAGLAAVLYEPYGAVLFLPYSKSWRFQIGDDGRVTGEDKDHSFTLTAGGAPISTEKEYLEAIVSNLKNSPVLLREIEFVEVKGDVVLRYQSRPKNLPEEFASLDPWWWHYWSVQGQESDWIDVHLSILQPTTELPENDEKLRDLLGRGLRRMQ